MAEEGATQKRKRSQRSPNYPALNLADAIERTRAVFDAHGTSRVGDEDIAKSLGYGKLHGTSRGVVSALKKYGLMEADGDGFKVSNDALDILQLESDNPERARAMHRAALKPTLFAELHETYGDSPPADSILRNALTKRSFNPKVADEVIRLYRDTMDLVSRKVEEYTPDEEPDESSGDERQERHMQRERTVSGGTNAPAFDIPSAIVRQQHYGLSADCDVHLLFGGEPTKQDIETLRAYLEIFERRLRSEDVANNHLGAPASTSSATTDSDSGENGRAAN